MGGVCAAFLHVNVEVNIIYQAKHCLAVLSHPVWIDTVRVWLLKSSGIRKQSINQDS